MFAHLPLLYNEQRKKLSKRRDKVAIEDYRDEGFLPEAVRNYLALLGWSPGGDREILSRRRDGRGVPPGGGQERAGAIFDERKMTSVNAEYLRALPVADLVSRGPGVAGAAVGAARPPGPGAGPDPGGGVRHDRLPVPARADHRPPGVGPRGRRAARLRGHPRRPRPSGTPSSTRWTADALQDATSPPARTPA